MHPARLFSALVAFAPFCRCQELSYEDSINALAYGNVALNGESSGTIWLNVTGFAASELPHIQQDLGIETLDNLEPLSTIAGLAKIAASKGQWGDLVFLYNAFALNGFADYIQATSEQMQHGLLEAVSGNNNTPDADLVALYAKTSSSPYLAKSFSSIKADSATLDVLEKRWSSATCASLHRAVTSTCQQLIGSIAGDFTFKSGNPRAICQYGCCISWSVNATFQYKNLSDAANYCIEACATSSVSCEVKGVNLQGTIVSQCLSNRADGCK